MSLIVALLALSFDPGLLAPSETEGAALAQDRQSGDLTVLKPEEQPKKMLQEYNNIPMPNQSLSDAEIRQFIKYFHWFDAQPGAGANMEHK